MAAKRKRGRLCRFAGSHFDEIGETVWAAECSLSKSRGNRRRHILARRNVVNAIVPGTVCAGGIGGARTGSDENCGALHRLTRVQHLAGEAAPGDGRVRLNRSTKALLDHIPDHMYCRGGFAGREQSSAQQGKGQRQNGPSNAAEGTIGGVHVVFLG